nr:endoglucanase-like [Ipomoea batatas]
MPGQSSNDRYRNIGLEPARAFCKTKQFSFEYNEVISFIKTEVDNSMTSLVNARKASFRVDLVSEAPDALSEPFMSSQLRKVYNNMTNLVNAYKASFKADLVSNARFLEREFVAGKLLLQEPDTLPRKKIWTPLLASLTAMIRGKPLGRYRTSWKNHVDLLFKITMEECVVYIHLVDVPVLRCCYSQEPTNLALWRSTDPSAFNFVLNTHLQSMGVLPAGSMREATAMVRALCEEERLSYEMTLDRT